MKRSLLIAICLTLCASFALAQSPGSIMIFSDPGYTECNIADVTFGLKPIYIVHMYTTEATASQWRLDAGGGCNLMTFTGAANAFPTTIGDVFSGISVAYGGCYGGAPILLVTVNYFAQGLTGSCCAMTIVPDPTVTSGNIEVVDCGSNRLFATGGTAIINSDGSCHCDVPVSESTWGGIKAMYQ